MTTKYGMFQEHQYLKPGCTPVPDDPASTAEEGASLEKESGLNFKVTVSKTGKGNDATFSKLTYIADRYVDPLKARLQSEAEKRTHNVVDRPFKLGHRLPKSATPGDYYGTSGKIPYMSGHIDIKQKKGEIAAHPRGIFTSPAKKGSFGTDKLTISQLRGHQGVAHEYEYLHDPASHHEEQQKAASEADRKARVADRPFKPTSPAPKGSYGTPGLTLSKGKGVAGEWEYVMAPPAEQGAGAAAPEGHEAAAFKPTNIHAAERMAHIPYLHDPEAPKLKAESDKKLAESKRIAATGAWKPTQGYKTDMVRSIVRMNLR